VLVWEVGWMVALLVGNLVGWVSVGLGSWLDGCFIGW
jgi:hypothetical protein